jgi:hypothetical protein
MQWLGGFMYIYCPGGIKLQTVANSTHALGVANVLIHYALKNTFLQYFVGFISIVVTVNEKNTVFA